MLWQGDATSDAAMTNSPFIFSMTHDTAIPFFKVRTSSSSPEKRCQQFYELENLKGNFQQATKVLAHLKVLH